MTAKHERAGPHQGGRVRALPILILLLAIAFALANPQAELTLVDESYMAVQSARENWAAALGERPATIREGGVLADVAPTLLTLMGMPVPAEMTGKTIVELE